MSSMPGVGGGGGLGLVGGGQVGDDARYALPTGFSSAAMVGSGLGIIYGGGECLMYLIFTCLC